MWGFPAVKETHNPEETITKIGEVVEEALEITGMDNEQQNSQWVEDEDRVDEKANM